jgi:GDPmannose 4,6-dehydratase
MNKVMISGITGQMGAILAEKYLKKGYNVYGLIRRCSVFNTERIDHLYKDPHESDRLQLIYADLANYSTIEKAINDVKPEFFINCAAQSHVKVSWDIPEYTMDVTGTGVLRCLEAIKNNKPDIRFVQCSSSEMFGGSPPPQRETTPFQPKSPYAIAKICGYHLVRHYREAYNIFASNAIMFNYEGTTRGLTFVTRKITMACARIKLGLQDYLYLGNLNSARDWSSVHDTANAIDLIINADEPDDFCVSTGDIHTVQELVEYVFGLAGLDWKQYVKIDERYLRPAEVNALCGDSTKIREKLGWKPEYNFEKLITEMYESDLKIAKKEKLLMDSK